MAERLPTNTDLVDVLDRVLFKGVLVELNGGAGLDRTGLSGRVVAVVQGEDAAAPSGQEEERAA